MTRRDSEVVAAEGDRGGGCSSRPPASSSSSTSSFQRDEVCQDKGTTRKVSLDEESCPGHPRLSTGKNGIGSGDDRKIETWKNRRFSKQECVVESEVSENPSDDSREPLRDRMEVCPGKRSDSMEACGSTATSTGTSTGTSTANTVTSLPNNPIVATTSGSSTPVGETRLTASILFDLPEPCGPSTDLTDNKMPAITKAQMKEFEDAFNLFDKDRDGSITKEELGRVMRGLGQFARTEELRTMLEEIDTDGDGNVSLVEFVKIVSNIGSASAAAPTDLSQEEQEEQELRDAFRVFDKHNRGYITASDLRAVLQCLGEDLSEEEIEDMIKEVDEDGDGRIDFYEFARSLVEPGTDDEDEDDEEDEVPQSPPF